MKGSTRIKIATVLLVLVCLVSIYEPIHFKNLRITRFSDIVIGLDRASCLKSALPKNVHLYGFLPAVSPDLQLPPQSLMLMRYVVAPDLISESTQAIWVIANYPDRESALQDIQKNRLSIITDCGNGVFLLKR